MTKIENATTYPKRFFGLHMTEGCAQYNDVDSAYMIFINNETIKTMGPTFEGKPVFVGHKDDVTPETPVDGHVVKSFFNQADGKHWVEFIVTSDLGIDAIKNEWKLSNAYHIDNRAGGGRWHGIDYDSEIMAGTYEHLAIVPDPRYSESVILTPDEFREYNLKKEAETKILSNSINKRGVSMFNFFKKEKVENSIDLESLSVMLPKSKKEVEISKLINEADEKACNEDAPEYAVEHMLVRLEDGEELPLSELLNRYNEMCNAKKNEDVKEDEVIEEKKENEVVVEEEVENKDEEEKEKHMNSLKNAEDDFLSGISNTIDLGMDKVARGLKRYGSK
jgi:hypothetical protein